MQPIGVSSSVSPHKLTTLLTTFAILPFIAYTITCRVVYIFSKGSSDLHAACHHTKDIICMSLLEPSRKFREVASFLTIY